MIRVIFRDPEGNTTCDTPVEQLPELLHVDHGSLWIDMQAPSNEEYHLIL